MSDGLVVGTYLAEQVALTSYALLSVSQADAKRSQISAVPSGPRVKRRLRDHNNFKADTLPALVSLDPLLQGATTAAEGPGPTAAAETQRRMRLTHIEISSARLAEGRQTWSTDRPTADQPPSRGDCQAIASLTAPLPWFRPGAPEPKKSLKKARSRRGSAGFSSTTNPWDLFSESLRGTGVERSPRKRSPSPPRKRDAGERAPRDLFHFGLAEQPLLPEDAVQAYFESEKARTDQLHEKEKEPKELEKVDGQRRYAIVKPLPHSDKVQREPLRVLRESKKSEPADPLMEGDALDRTKFFAELLDQMFFKQKFSPVRRDACQLTRMFVLGSVGNENCRNKKDRENVFFESCGTKDDMHKLLRAWDKIDVDCSGRVDLAEVRSLGDRLMIDVVAAGDWAAGGSTLSGKSFDNMSGVSRLPAWIANTPQEERPRFVQRFCDRLASVLTNARKQSFCIEDIMRLIWSCSSEEDLRQMRSWCDEINRTRDKWRVSPPPVLPSEEKAALQAVFNYFDKDRGGSVSANELILFGLIDKDYAKEFINVADTDGNGEIDMAEFCELMCPHGFRASETSVTGSTVLGQPARLDDTTKTWRLKEAPPAAAEIRPSRARAKERARPPGGH